jgi:hypothetical protein
LKTVELDADLLKSENNLRSILDEVLSVLKEDKNIIKDYSYSLEEDSVHGGFTIRFKVVTTLKTKILKLTITF